MSLRTKAVKQSPVNAQFFMERARAYSQEIACQRHASQSSGKSPSSQ
jgi:hypothetical protein